MKLLAGSPVRLERHVHQLQSVTFVNNPHVKNFQIRWSTEKSSILTRTHKEVSYSEILDTRSRDILYRTPLETLWPKVSLLVSGSQTCLNLTDVESQSSQTRILWRSMPSNISRITS